MNASYNFDNTQTSRLQPGFCPRLAVVSGYGRWIRSDGIRIAAVTYTGKNSYSSIRIQSIIRRT